VTLRTLTALAALCLLIAPIRAQVLDDAGIARALKAGSDNKFGAWTAGCTAEASRSERRASKEVLRPTGSYDVMLSTNLGAIAVLAHQAKGGKTPAVSEVPTWALKPAVNVFVEPRTPPRDWGAAYRGLPIMEVPSSIERVVLSSTTAPTSAAPEPESFETADASFSESRWLESYLPKQIGPDGRPTPMVFERSRARATFSIESMKALPAGDLNIMIVTKDGERRCAIRARDRVRLFP
jgi:hypothetical protein